MIRIAISTKSYVPDFEVHFIRNNQNVLGTREDFYDDFMMSTTLIEDNDDYYFWITIDYGVVRPIVVDLIYEGICKITSKIKKKNLFVGATHTHSSPQHSKNQAQASHEQGFVETRENTFVEFLDHLGKIAGELFVECESKLTTFHSDIKVTEIEGCYSNRNGLDMPCDKNLTLIRFMKNDTNELVGMWMNMSCHSTVMWPRNVKMSSDLVGGVAKKLAKYYGIYPQPSCGCQGDTSLRLTKKKTNSVEEDLVELDRITNSIVNQVTKDDNFEPILIDRFDVKEISLKYSYQIDPKETEMRLKKILDDQAKEPDEHTKFLYDGNIKIFKHRLGATEYNGSLESKAINLGELKIGVFNGELVNSLGLEIVRHLPHNHQLVVGYINDEAGYLVANDNKNFESLARIIPSGLTRVLVDLVIDRLNSFK